MDTPETTLTPRTWDLLERLKNLDDSRSWSDFLSRYRGQIRRAAVRAGCNPFEAEEVVQETAISVARRISMFEATPRLGSFEGWLLRLTHCRVVDQFRKRHKGTHLPAFSDNTLEHLEPEIDGGGDRTAGTDLERAWEREWRQHCLDTALLAIRRRISPQQFEVFHRCVVLLHPACEVARHLNITIDQVYLVKHRVLIRMRKELRRNLDGRGGN